MLVRNFILLALLFAAWLPVNVFAEEGGAITVHFVDAYGGSAGIQDLTIAPGETIVLPKAPADKKAPDAAISGAPAWKPTLGMYDNYLKSSAGLTYEQALSLYGIYGSDNVLTFYGTRVLFLTHYDNDGTRLLWRRYAYEGANSVLYNSPNPNNLAYRGWGTVKGGGDVVYKFGEKIQMKKNLNVYLVTFSRIRYYAKNGSKLIYSGYYKRGTKATMLPVPDLTNYRTLGWSTQKSGSGLFAASNAEVTVTKNLDLYAAYRYLPYTVKFTSNDGKTTSSAYSKLNVRVAAGESVTLPKPPAVTNLIALGWSTKANDTAAQKKAGDQVKISNNVTYYAVYREPRTLTLTYVDQNGSTSSAFSALKRTIKEGTKFILPALPEKSGYLPICWKLNVNGTVRSYNAGSTIAVYGNCRFYASYKEKAEVVLHYNDGKVYKTVAMTKGTEYSLPCMANEYGRIFMGWAGKAGVTLNQSNPCKTYYEPDTTIVVNGIKHYYAVVMRRSEEPNLAKSQLSGASSPDTSAYKKIIFVGDSRTSRLKLTLVNREIDIQSRNVCFVHKSGSSLDWLKTDGYQQLLNTIDRDNDPEDKRPTAIIFNSGVNGLANYAAYAAFYKSVASTLQNRNCRLFIMSVNPVNSYMIDKIHYIPRRLSEIRTFNDYMKNNLSGDYTYIDTYSWLMQTGYSTDRGDTGYDTGVDDGLHYTQRTYKRIYLRCLQALAASN